MALHSYDVLHHILKFAVDFEYRKEGLYSKKEQIECISKFQAINRELSEAMESVFNLFWSKVLKRDVVNLELFHEEELERQLIVTKTLKRKVILARLYKRKLNHHLYGETNRMEIVKVLMLGPSGSGKSTLVNQYFAKELEENQGWRDPVIEDSMCKLIWVDDEKVYIDINEVKGNSEYEALIPMSSEAAEAFVIVVSNNDLHSLIETRRQLDILLEVKENRTDIPIIFAINKVDRDDSKSQIEFWREKIQEIIEEFKLINVGILETCYVKNTNVEKNVNELFEAIVKRYRYGTWKDVELLKQVISQDVLILQNKKKKCICM